MITTSNISLKVPFNEKDSAKALGARWNAEAKQWYVPQGIDAAPFEKWFTSSQSSSPTQPASKPITSSKTHKTDSDQPIDDDLEAINAKLRDAYEPRDGDIF